MAAVSRSGRARGDALPFPGVASLRGLTIARALPSGRALLLGFALLGAGALAYVGARETSLFALRTITIKGAPPRVASHVRAALSSLEGRSLLSLNQGVVERHLAGLPDVARVTVNRDFPHTLRLLVAPAHSIAVLRRSSFAWIVSSDGEVIRAAGLFAAPKLPRIWVPRATSIDTGAPLEDADAVRAVHALAVARGAGFGARIAAVRSSDSELTFVPAAGPEIRLGDMSSLPLKLVVAQRILPLAGATSGYVDVSLPDRPISGGNPKVAGRG